MSNFFNRVMVASKALRFPQPADRLTPDQEARVREIAREEAARVTGRTRL